MQLQLVYDPAEDRLLLSLAVDDRTVSFWLTRRMTALLWQALWRRAGSALDGRASAAAREWLLSLQLDEVCQKHVLTHEPRMALKVQPILATTVKFGSNETSGHALELTDLLGNGELLSLDDTSLYALIRLIDETAAATGWGLDLWRPQMPPAEVPPASTAVH